MTGMIPYPVSPQVELLDASQILEAGDFPTYREHQHPYIMYLRIGLSNFLEEESA